MTNKRICVSYLITAILILVFVYYMSLRNIKIESKVNNLQEEVSEIARLVTRGGGGGVAGLGSIQSRGAVTGQTDIVSTVESVVKKRIAAIWDELSNIKKQFITSKCSHSMSGFIDPATSSAVGEKREERPNYALESLGAKIESIEGKPWNANNFLWVVPVYVSNEPKNIINPSMQPGHCYAFRKNNSAVTIKLSEKVFVEAFELEHISDGLVPGDTSSAPKDFSVYGIDSKAKFNSTHLGDFKYDNSLAQRAQLFQPMKVGSYDFVKVNFTSNYGNPNHTCVYRFAVYGKAKV